MAVDIDQSKIVQLKNISKAFAGVPVLKAVDFDIHQGVVHGLIGGNGAGKSTLMKILCGVHAPDQGDVWIKGSKRRLKRPADAHQLGICLVPQEPMLYPYLTIEENVLLGMPGSRRENRRKMKALMSLLNCGFRPDHIGADLTIAKQQLAALLQGLVRESDVIVLDEPTSALTAREVDALFTTLKTLVSEKGTAVVYISHRLKELFQITDEISILHNGAMVLHDRTENLDLERIIRIMVPSGGAPCRPADADAVSETDPVCKPRPEASVLEVDHLTGKGFRNVCLRVGKGEILGLTGVVGAGRTELAEALFGISHKASGRILWEGREVDIQSPRQAVEQGLIYLPEDRHLHGGFLEAGIGENISASVLYRLFSWFIRRGQEKDLAEGYIQRLKIQCTGVDQTFKHLSGGNQQKVVLGKWLAPEPKLIILDEPTRGIDANARSEIYANIRKLTDDGIAVLMISSDFEEVAALCDRVAIMFAEEIVTELTGDKINLENITFASFGYAKAV